MLKKIASIVLATFFLLSSSHLSFATHFCGGKAYKHALLVSANDFGCGMENKMSKCENNSNKVEKECCENELVNLSINDNFQSSLSKISVEQHFVFIAIASVLFSVPTISSTIISFQDYHPPLPDRDILVLFQSFLI